MSDMKHAPDLTDLPIWTLGDRLRKSREWAGIKQQEEMARRLSKSRAAIAGWETDKHRPDALALRAWAYETGVPLWWLLDDDPGEGMLDRRAPRSTKW